jgi:beta-phosphoglucomutase family hydrolase
MSNKITFTGAVFDMDGVITKTAHVHSIAWKAMFDEYLKHHCAETNCTFVPFSEADDYLNYVDGKPRYEGVRSFLDSRGIELPFGAPEDEPSFTTVCGLGNKKNILFQDILEREGAEVFESSVELIKNLKAKGIKVALATSSKNCRIILKKAGLTDMFESIVDGVRSAELKLNGKPDPVIFITAASELGLFPEDCILVEDAISGVEAGKRGNFGLVIGVSRGMEGEKLKVHGADFVVDDLEDISPTDINIWFTKRVKHDNWYLTYYGFDGEQEKLREALTTVGNGYFGTRGSLDGEEAGEISYPGTYIAGIYNALPTDLHGTTIYNNDFVNCPNWTKIRFRMGDGAYKTLSEMEILSYRHRLDIKNAVNERKIIFRDHIGRITHLVTRRFASMDDPHTGAIYYELIPLNYTSTITIRSEIDGNIINEGVPRYKTLNSHHLDFVDATETEDSITLHTRTNVSKYDIYITAKHRLVEHDTEIEADRRTVQEDACIGQEFRFYAVEGNRYEFEKLVAIHTSNDDEKNPLKANQQLAKSHASYTALLAKHSAAWQNIWDTIDLHITADRFSQRTLRLHMYHLLCTASPHNKHIDAGLTARGLHGEAYRGHIFWDEVYVYPFFNAYFPEITKALLMYRYNRLDGAREYAKEHGFEGAMYPWQTADGGNEETQIVHYNPMSGNWDPDLSSRQRHVSIAIFYNVWTYVNHTGDTEFLEQYGAELMFEIARFWASITHFDAADDRYHISGVMGPDEYHEKMPDSSEAGVTDNAYTNIMVVWIMEKMMDLLKDLDAKAKQAVFDKIDFKNNETEKWQQMIQKMNVNIDENGIIEQFNGYFTLPELDWAKYRQKYGNIHRMDRILKSENDSPDHYKVAKQADVLMLYYLLAPEKVHELLLDLGYNNLPDARELLKRNYEYYVQRTSHGSTLSKVVHATVSRFVTKDNTTWDWFMGALKSDVEDSQGGTTLEGIHTGVMAGTIEIAIRNFCGIAFEHDRLVVNPNLPPHWRTIEFSVWHHCVKYNLILQSGSVTVTPQQRDKNVSCGEEVTVEVHGKLNQVKIGETKKVAY